MTRAPNFSRATVGGIALMAVCMALSSPADRAAALPDRGGPGLERPTGADVDGMSPRIAALASLEPDERVPRMMAEAAGLPEDGPGALQRDGSGRLIVDVTLAGPIDVVVASLDAIGAEVMATDSGPILATVAVPIESLGALAQLTSVGYVAEVTAPYRAGGASTASAAPTSATCRTGTVSEGDAHLRAGDARSASGTDGTGVIVGVVSDSYDDLGGAATDITDGELPGSGNPCGRTAPVDVQSDLGGGGTDEGRAMLQIVHDLAPGAALRFASGAAGELAMAEQIRQLGLAGADIITDDIGYFGEPMFQDGPIAQAIDENHTQRGILHFTAAGNSNKIIGGRNVASYEAPSFRPTACPASIPIYQNACHDHDTTAATDAGGGLTLRPGGSIIVNLGWSEPMYGVTTDLDLYLVDTVTNAIVAESEFDNTATKRAAEFLTFENTTGTTRTFDVVIGRFAGSATAAGTPRFRTVVIRSNGLDAVEYDRSFGGDVVGPSIFGHAAESTAVSVAAMSYATTSTPETFSSRGPSSICWGPVDGTVPQPAITPCASVTLDITATDGAVNSFFGSPSGSDRRFFGTSAAAPHAAAVAALLADHDPCATAERIESAIRAGATPIGTFGADVVGAGLVDAVAALSVLDTQQTCAPAIAPIADVVVAAGQASAPIAITLTDPGDGPTGLVTTAASSDTSVLPDGAITIDGDGNARTMLITPPIDSSGTVEVTVSVRDPDGLSAAASFEVRITLHDDADAFSSTTPRRYADSRDEMTFDGRFRNTGMRPADSAWEIDIAGRGSVPSDAMAAIVNLTVLDGTDPGFATVYPCGQRPTASSVNYLPGGFEANEVVAKLSPTGTICIYTLTQADVIVDLVGYVAADSPYVPITPSRFADSRTESTFDGGFRDTGPRPSHSTWEIDIAGRGEVPGDATAAVANITVTGGLEPGFATVFPCGDRPNASSLNYGPGVTRPNEVVAQLTPTGTLCVFTLTDVDVIIDVVGYLTARSGISIGTPHRYADSRDEETFDATFRATGRRPGGTVWEIDVAGRGGIPAGASTAIANVTVTGADEPGFATVYPCGSLPVASSLNYAPGVTRANELVAKLSPTGTLCVFTLTDVDVIVDISGHR